MSQTGYAAQRRRPGVLIAIVGGHAAVLAAVMLAKMEIPPKFVPPPQIVDHIPLPTPPKEPPPPEPSPRPEPRADQRVTQPVPLVPTPVPGPIFEAPTIDPPIFDTSPPGPVTIPGPPTPPTIPLPVEPPAPPAPRAKPVKLSPRGDPASWVTNDDYPSAALRSEEQGRTIFVVTAGADGRPSDCRVTGSSGSSTLDNAACRLLMKRAKFKPGTDADGNAAGGTWSSSFRWQIPED